jgi:UDP-N-acetylmuramoyl-L-alanyl-D-glutamate--2,6-diaminopimelate ligase
LEVTSEGIRQHRHQFIDFDVAVFTNLAPEHIESHGSFEKYRAAKGKLFQATKNIHIINLDDPHADYFWQFPAITKIGYKKQDFEKFQPLSLKLPGEFNIYNALAAIYFALSQGIDLKTCQRALEKVEGIPGRMEIVIKEPFQAIVDYAHTPDALEKVYKTINGRKICVLGSAGGGRDRWKRPKMGEIASKYCDEIILTNEDPYDENPSQILSQIKSGIPDTKHQILDTILDRREAIKKALNLARPGDTVIITGKGCEPWLCVENGKKIPWDDRKIVREEFNRLKIL